jgi:hypothetical protein
MSNAVQFMIEGQKIYPEHTKEVHPAINAVANACIKSTFDENALLNPSAILVTPTLQTYGLAFALQSWHETDSHGKVGRLQHHESIFLMSQDEYGAYLISESDETIRISDQQQNCLIAVFATAAVGRLVHTILQPPESPWN